MTVIAVAGFQHETNSFSPVSADWASFGRTTSWPGLTIGDDLIPAMDGMNLALAGFIAQAQSSETPIQPILWANATPSGPVTDEAFEKIAAVLLGRLTGVQNLAAVFLDLHGAMITQSYSDGEAEILRRVRAVVGNIPLVASLDLHANVSPTMCDLADALIPCRTYPHIDLAETGRRAFRTISRLTNGRVIFKTYRQPDYLIPIHAQTTHLQPAQRLYDRATELEREYDLLSLSLTLGFGPSDTTHCGPAICAFGFDKDKVEAAADVLYEEFLTAEGEFTQPLCDGPLAVARALEMGKVGKPIILADLQDNPGAGGTGDTTGLLDELIKANVEDAVLAVLFDPATAAIAHSAGEGATIKVELGGKMGGPGSVPIECDVIVEKLGSGQFQGTGPMYGGAKMDLGKMACLKLLSGPRVIVGSVNTHTGDQAILRHLEIEPSEQKVLVLKSAVHFRADFEPIASEIIVVKSPGSNAADHHEYKYQHLRPNLRLMPAT